MRPRRYSRVCFFVLGIVLFLSVESFAQGGASAAAVRQQVGKLNNALLTRDSLSLKGLLHDKVTYGHSNGWIESKREVIDDLYNGKLAYNKIGQDEPNIEIDGNTAIVRSNVDLAATLNGNAIQMKLSVLQVWIKKGRDWQLLGRQSVKL